MYFLYNLAVHFAAFALPIIAFFNPKIRLFTKGRAHSFPYLEKNISAKDKIIWMHAASLGEFEQGLPVIEKLRLGYPGYKVLVTFFSPSGYEVKKDSKAADFICYLPLDTAANARRFVALVKPKVAIFVKYEIWPNYLKVLEENSIPVVLISAIFKKRQVYFKGYGGFMRQALRKVSCIFVQNTESEELLRSIGISDITVSGDTRFDRVAEILQRNNELAFMEEFKNGQLCFVAGSTWKEDEQFLAAYINECTLPVQFVIAPHTMDADHMTTLLKRLSKKTVRYSELDTTAALGDFQVLLVDTIGLLTKIYSYADVAYVGGGFATGLHNTLEPAVFAIPVIIGPNYRGFREAEDLVRLGGIFPVKNGAEFADTATGLLGDTGRAREAGGINAAYIAKNKGASLQIINHIRTLV